MNSLIFFLLGLSAATALAAVPDDVSPYTSRGPSAVKVEIANAVKSSDTFAKSVAQDGITEIAAGKLAATHASNRQIKDFAQRMVADHSQANSELRTIAKTKGIDLPDSVDRLDAKHQAIIESLKSKSGADFDAAYSKEMSMAHQNAVELFRQASYASGIDPILQAFARKTLPTLEEHEKLAGHLLANAGS